MSQEKNRPQNNPYASATGAYDQNAQDHAADPRELEARVLLKAVRRLQDLQNKWEQMKPADLEEVLRYNRNIWMMFMDTAAQDKNGHTKELRANITNLGGFVCNHSLAVLAKPEKGKLDILIKINREIAAGLMTRPPGLEQPKQAAPGGNEKGQRISAET